MFSSMNTEENKKALKSWSFVSYYSKSFKSKVIIAKTKKVIVNRKKCFIIVVSRKFQIIGGKSEFSCYKINTDKLKY